MRSIVSGAIYKWVGIPGQYENENRIRIDSLSADCQVNAAVVDEDGNAASLVSIGAADLVTAINQGWLVRLS